MIGGLFAGFGMAISWTITEVEMMLLTYSVVMGTFYSFKSAYQKFDKLQTQNKVAEHPRTGTCAGVMFVNLYINVF